MILTNASDFRFLNVSQSIDEDHPHGDVDRIDLSVDVRPNRGSDDRDMLSGKDIAVLMEAVGERDNFNSFLMSYPAFTEPTSLTVDTLYNYFYRQLYRSAFENRMRSLYTRNGLASQMADPAASLTSFMIDNQSSSVIDYKRIFLNHFGQQNASQSDDYVSRAGFNEISIPAASELEGSMIDKCFDNVTKVTRFARLTVQPSMTGATGTMENQSGGVGSGATPLDYVLPYYCYHDFSGSRASSKFDHGWGWHKSVHSASTNKRLYVACPADCDVHLFWTGWIYRNEVYTSPYYQTVNDNNFNARIYVGSKSFRGTAASPIGCVSFSNDEIRAAVKSYIAGNIPHDLDVSQPVGDGQSESGACRSLIYTNNYYLGVVIDVGSHTRWW